MSLSSSFRSRTADAPEGSSAAATTAESAPPGVPAFARLDQGLEGRLAPRSPRAQNNGADENSAPEEAPPAAAEPKPSNEPEDKEPVDPEQAEKEGVAEEAEGSEEESNEAEGEEEEEEEEEEGGEDGEGAAPEGEASAEGQLQGDAPAPVEPADQVPVPTPDELGIDMPRPARIFNVRPPQVGPPPVLPAKQIEAIRKQTRLSPDEHHDRVRAAVSRASRVASRAQVEVVNALEGAAERTHGDILQRAAQIPALIGAAIGEVTGTLTAASADVNTHAATEAKRITNFKETNGNLADQRKETTLTGVEAMIGQASADMLAAWGRIKTDLLQVAKGPAKQMRETPNEGTIVAKAKSLGEDYKSRNTGPNARKRYSDERIGTELEALGRDKAKDMIAGAKARGDALEGDEFLTQFALQFLKVLNPALVAEQVEGGNVQDKQGQETKQTRLVFASARQQALGVVEASRSRATAVLEQTQKDLATGLRKSGDAARRVLENQAESGRRGLLVSAVSFADAYQTLANELRGTLPAGQFFDATQYVRRFDRRATEAQKLRRNQLDEAASGRREAVRASDEALEEQTMGIRRTVASGVETAATQKRSAITRMTQVADHFTQGIDLQSGLFQTGSEGFYARAGKELGENHPKRVEQTFKDTIHGPVANGQPVAAALGKQATDYKAEVDKEIADLDRGFRKTRTYDPIAKAALAELDDRAKQYDNAANGGFLGGAGTDEDGMINALMGLTRKGMAGLDFTYTKKHSMTLEQEARDEMDGTDEGDDLYTALALINGQNAKAALSIAKSSTGWFGFSRKTREAAIRSLNDEERQAMVKMPGWDAVAKEVAKLPPTEAKITQELVKGDKAKALALSMGEELEASRQSLNEDKIQDNINGLDAKAAEWVDGPFRKGRVRPEQANKLKTEAFREHAILSSNGKLTREAANALTEEQAATQFADFATRDIRHWVQHGEDGGEWVETKMSKTGVQAMRDTIIKGSGSPESRASRLIYEQERAKLGGVTETRTERIAEVAENPSLAQARKRLKEAQNAPDRDPKKIAAAQAALDREEKKQDDFLKQYATKKGAPPEVMKDRTSLTDYAAKSLGDTFAGETVKRGVDYGRKMGDSMIRDGRMDLLAATLVATDKLGTHENLMKKAYAGRDAAEFDALKKSYKGVTGKNFDDEMFNDTFSELSGDDALEIKQLMRGEPKNDRELMKNQFLRTQDELSATGPDGRMHMEASPEGRYLHEKRQDAAQLIRDAVRKNHPEIPEDKIVPFGPDGTPNKLAFDEKDGHFLGDSIAFTHVTHDLQDSVDVWRTELEQAESLLTSIIQVVGAIVGVLLMFVPGVNVIVAGVVTALVIGAATMSIKASMRGSRYGWEEAAVDVASTALDAATAGIGGIGQTARVAGTAARSGSALARSVARQAATGFISSAANTAMQDNVWADGLGKGLGRVLGAGVRGGLVGGVSAGISDSLSNKLDRALNPKVVGEATEAATRGLGHGTRRALSEALSSSAGAMASEAVGAAYDKLSGQHVDWGQALGQIAFAGAKDFVVGGMRGGVMAHMQGRMRDETRRMLESDVPPTPEQMKLLHRLAISTGQAEWGGRSLADFSADFHARRQVIGDLPPGMRRNFADLPLDGLLLLKKLVDDGEVGTMDQRRALTQMLAQGGLRDRSVEDVTLDLQRGLRESDDAAAASRALRKQLAPEVPAGVRGALTALPPHLLASLHGLDGDTVKEIGARLARGEPIDGALRDRVLATVLRTRGGAALDNAGLALERLGDVARLGKVRLSADAPAALHTAMGALPDRLQRTVRDLADAGVPPSPDERRALRNVLGSRADDVLAALPTAHPRAKTLEALGDLPPRTRSVLADLPDDTVHALRMLQARGEATPHDKATLLARALEANPKLDGRAFLRAVDAVVTEHAGTVRVSDSAAELNRTRVLAGVPPELHALVDGVPIKVVRDDVFAAATRNHAGDAVTIVVDGRPQILLREGAPNPAHALREEGVHVLQVADPKWGAHVRLVSEDVAANWHDLSLGERVEAHRRQVALEIDAQRQVIAGLTTDPRLPTDPKLRTQLTVAEARLRGLNDRLQTLQGLGVGTQLLIRTGVRSEPDFLRQPARLFMEDGVRPLAGVLDAPGRVLTDDEWTSFLKAHPPEVQSSLQRAANVLGDARGVLVEVVRGLPPGSERLISGLVQRVEGLESPRQFVHGLQDVVRAFPPDVAHDIIESIAGPRRHYRGTDLAEFTAGLATIAREVGRTSDPDAVRSIVKVVLDAPQDGRTALVHNLANVLSTGGPDAAPALANLLAQRAKDPARRMELASILARTAALVRQVPGDLALQHGLMLATVAALATPDHTVPGARKLRLVVLEIVRAALDPERRALAADLISNLHRPISPDALAQLHDKLDRAQYTTEQLELIDQYRSRNPTTQLTNRELADAWEQGYRFNAKTGRLYDAARFEPPSVTAHETPESHRADVPVGRTASDNAELARRNDAIRRRMDLLDEADRLTKVGDEAGATKARDAADKTIAEINRSSEKLGEAAADAYAGSLGAKLVYAGRGSHTVDRVYQTSDGKFIVVEAKGGESPLGSRRTSEGLRVQQGTKDYLTDVLAAMEKKGGEHEDVAKQLRRALSEKRVDYKIVRQPIRQDRPTAGDVKDTLENIQVGAFRI